MTTLQSQINILVASLTQLYDGIKYHNDKFSLVKLNYENTDKATNKTFQSLPTYVLAMDIDKDFPCAQYDVSLGIYESTVDEHTFEYVVPEKYTLKEGYPTFDIDSFKSDFIHGTFTDNNNLKILLNFPQLINLGSNLELNSMYVSGGVTTSNYNNLIDGTGENITTRSISTQQHTEIIKKLRNMQTQLESQHEETCVDLVNENFESIVYNNVYQLTENGNLTLKELTNHPLKKHLTLPQSENIYILECDTNTKYYLK